MLIVITDGADPQLTWQNTNENTYVQEHNAPVASFQTVQAGDKTLEAYFSFGYSLPIKVRTEDTIVDNSGSPDSVLRWNYQDNDSIQYAITGGADAEKFLIFNAEIYFKARPDYDNPSDANGDNVYEVEVTATAGSESISKVWRVNINQSSDEDVSKSVSPPSELSIFTLKEKPESSKPLTRQ